MGDRPTTASTNRRVERRGQLLPVAVALGVVTAITVVDALWGNVIIYAAVLLGPLLAAAYVGPVVTALVGLYAVAAAIFLGWADDIVLTSRHAIGVGIVTIAGGVAVWLAQRRAQREQELAATLPDARQARRLAVALSAGRMGTWSWERAGDVVAGDDRLGALFGRDPATFPPAFGAWLDFVHVEDRAWVEDAIRRAVAERSPFRFDHRVVWPDGSVHWLETIGEITTSDDEVVRGAVGVAID